MTASNLQSINSPELLKAGDPLELTLYGVKTVFRYCPPGKFLMGSPEDETCRDFNEIQHEVTLTRGFWLLETPVTQALWKTVTGENPSNFQGIDARPVEQVSWDDCNSFIQKLNAERLAPDGLKFDFPTEAEWEYACRAGTTTPYNCGDKLTEYDANFGDIFGGTTPVKSYAPNAWGLYDMHGNVEEWGFDRFDLLFGEPPVDPQGSKYGSRRVIRGGSWFGCVWSCRSADRGLSSSEERYSFVGFRLALRSLN